MTTDGIDAELERLLEHDPGILMDDDGDGDLAAKKSSGGVGCGADADAPWTPMPQLSALPLLPPPPPAINVVEQVKCEYLPNPDNRY